MEAKVILEDGKCFEGEAFGATGKVFGEVVSHNAMIGCQQVITDPAGAGLIVCMTYPLIGNYGVNREDVESSHFYLKGLIVTEFCKTPSNFRCEENLNDYMTKHGIVGISNVDTRSLSSYIRDREPLKGAVVSNDEPVSSILKHLKSGDYRKGVNEVTVDREYHSRAGEIADVVIIDLGVRLSLLRALHENGLKTVLIPGSSTWERIDELNPKAIIVAGGPGDPCDVPESIINNVKKLVGRYPLLGISLGMQVIIRGMGGATSRLKTGHRGDNYPVKDIENGRVHITSQNRGFTVDKKYLPHEIVVTHFNANDASIEGIRHRTEPVWGIEFWPYYLKRERAFSPNFPEPFLKALIERGA